MRAWQPAQLSRASRISAHGPHDFLGNQARCRPGVPTGRFFNRLATASRIQVLLVSKFPQIPAFLKRYLSSHYDARLTACSIIKGKPHQCTRPA